MWVGSMYVQAPGCRVGLSCLLAGLIVLSSAGLARSESESSYEGFSKLIQQGQKDKALEEGARLFVSLLAKYPGHAGLALVDRQLNAAKGIADQVGASVKAASQQLFKDVANLDGLGLPASPVQTQKAVASSVVPAQQLYWTNLDAFSKEADLKAVRPEEASFVRQYYDLKMYTLILQVARQVGVAGPESADLACHMAVLPLLHTRLASSKWDGMAEFYGVLGAGKIQLLSEFSLLQAERAEAAMVLAKLAAEGKPEVFDVVQWSIASGQRCIESHRPDLAEQVIEMAAGLVKDREQVAALRLKIPEAYGQCNDDKQAAVKCKAILPGCAETSVYGKAMAAYFGYLAKQADYSTVLAEIDPALADPRCEDYTGSLLFLKWWALRKNDRYEEAGQVGQKLVAEHATNPCVAPVMLSLATDALAGQEYQKCREILDQLIKGFPDTESSTRAQEMLGKLEKHMQEKKI